MPRRDKTFSDADVIRIWCEHLTSSEQLNVLLFFDTVLPAYIEDEVGKSTIRRYVIALLRDKLSFALIRDIISRLVDIDFNVVERLILSHFRRQKNGRELVRVVMGCLSSNNKLVELLKASRASGVR